MRQRRWTDDPAGREDTYRFDNSVMRSLRNLITKGLVAQDERFVSWIGHHGSFKRHYWITAAGVDRMTTEQIGPYCEVSETSQ
jgi:hypothetical protein